MGFAVLGGAVSLLAQAPPSHAAAASSYAVFGGVLASAVIAGLMVQMAVRSQSPQLKEYPAHPLGFALALLTTSVLLFTALAGRPANVGSMVAFVVPACLLAGGGVLTFAGIAWLAMGTGASFDELVNWRILSRAATAVAATLTWQSFSNARDIVAPDSGWKTGRFGVAAALLLVGPILVSLAPGVRRMRERLGGQPSGTILLRTAVVTFVLVAVGLWVLSGERDHRVGDASFLNVVELVMAGGLGVLFALFDATLPLTVSMPVRELND